MWAERQELGGHPTSTLLKVTRTIYPPVSAPATSTASFHPAMPWYPSMVGASSMSQEISGNAALPQTNRADSALEQDPQVTRRILLLHMLDSSWFRCRWTTP